MVLLLVACGDDADDDAGGLGGLIETTSTTEATTTTAPPEGPVRDEYVTAIADQLAGSPEFPLADAEVRCVAGAIVDLPGVEQLQAAGITPAALGAADSLADLDVDLPADAQERLGQDLAGCVDFRTAFGTAFEGAFGDGVDLTCLVESIDQDEAGLLLAEAFIAGGDTYAMGEDFGRSMFSGISPACAEQILLDGTVAAGDLTPEQAACVAGSLEDEVALRMLQAAASGQAEPDPADATALTTAAQGCGPTG